MKYIIINDLEYLIHHKKKFLLLLLGVPVIIGLIYSIYVMDSDKVIYVSLGNHYRISESLPVELVMYIFNLCMYIYLVFDIYIKDLNYQLDHIFLRISLSRWFFNKTCLFLIIIFVLKLLEYGLVGVGISFFSDISFLKIFHFGIIDFLYIITIQLLLLVLYVVCRIIYAPKSIVLLLTIFLLVIIPKDIIAFSFKTSWLLFIIIGCIFFNCILLKFFGSKLIQRLGGE